MRHSFILLFLFSLMISCSSDDDANDENSASMENFYALKVGNSWVYKNYKYNGQSDNYEDTGVIDAVTIVGTEEVSGNTYFKFRTVTTGNEEGIVFCNDNGEKFELLRESDGNLVSDNGTILFTNNNFDERLLQENDWGNIYEVLIEGENNIDVEAGEFTSLKSEKYAKSPEGEQFPGKDKTYYADGFGLISKTFSLVSNETPVIIRRLDSYQIQ